MSQAPQAEPINIKSVIAEPSSGRSIDHFALNSLCWTRSADGSIHTAPRADALATPETPISAQAIFDYLYFHCIPSPQTIFEGVNRVPANHQLKLEAGAARVELAYAPKFSIPRKKRSFEALKAEFIDLIKRSVTQGLGNGPAACFLSGGTDSSTIAGMIHEVTGQGAEAFSIGFEAEGYDEMEYARLAAKHFGAKHHEYYISPDDLVKSIPAMAASFDQPFGNSSVLPAYYCSLKAREAGMSRLLAGDGGDELFGGNARYAKQRVFGIYQKVPAPVRQFVLEPFFALPAVARLPGLKKGSSYIEQARVPLPARLQMYNLLQRLGVNEVLQDGFLARIDQAGPGKHQQQVWDWAGAAGPSSELNHMLAFDWRYTLAESDIPKVKSAAELAGIEVAFPLLSNELLEFSLSLPDDYKLKGNRLRWFFKEALRGFLPDEIINKPKHGFGLPFGPWMLKHKGLHDLAADSLNSLG